MLPFLRIVRHEFMPNCRILQKNLMSWGRPTVGVLLCAITFWLGFSLDSAETADFVRRYGYYFTLVSSAAFVVYLGWWAFGPRHSALPRIRPGRCIAGLLVVLGGAGVVFHGSELEYKILMDDYLLAATGKSLHESGEVAVADFGREIDGNFMVAQSFVDKRPWFYPFLVSILHDTLGYDPVHPFVVNAVLAVVFLGVVFALGHALGGLGGAVLSVLLWASLPLLQQNATGGGMEMLNLTMIHLVILLSVWYLRSPCAAGEGALCLAGVLLTYSRYESGLFIGAILIVLALGWRRGGRIFLSLPALCAAPLLLGSLVQTRMYAATESSWELAGAGLAPFGLDHFWTNLPHAFSFFWSLDPAIANSLWLGLLAIPAVLGFACLCFRERRSDWWQQPANQAWAIFSLFLLLNLIVVLCFHAAQFDKRYVARYSLPTHGLIVFSTVACLNALGRRPSIWGVSIGLTVLFLIGVTLPKNRQALYTEANFMIKEQHWLEALDAAHLSSDALVIDRFNVAWTLRERAALPPHIARIHAERIKEELAAGKYRQVFLVARLADPKGEPDAGLPAVSALLRSFEAKLVEEQSFREGSATRFYRLGL